MKKLIMFCLMLLPYTGINKLFSSKYLKDFEDIPCGSEDILFSAYIENRSYRLVQNLFDTIAYDDIESLKEKYVFMPFLFNSVTWTGSNLLHLASIFNRYDIAEFLLLEVRISPNIFDHLDETPLSYAIRFKHYEMAELLIKYHADINIQDKKGRTPLHLTILYKRPRFTLLLLHHQADRDIPDKEGAIPFNYYANYNS